jgi:hypothetical protein
MKFLIAILLFIAAAWGGPLAASRLQTNHLATDSAVSIASAAPDSTAVSPPKTMADSVRAAAASAPKDTSKHVAPSGDAQKIKLMKRNYNGKHQMLLAVFMMVFVIGIVTMAQQWNPR